MKRIFATVGLVAGLAWVGSADAAVLYTQPYDGTANLFASQNDTTGGFGNFATTYDNFKLASSSNITSVDFTGGYFNPGAPGTITKFTLTIYSDVAGAPGAALYTQVVNSNGNEVLLSGNIDTYDIATSFIAAAGTEYWVSVVPDLGFPPQWGWATGTGGDGIGYQCFFGACGQTGNDFAFTLNGQGTVPEPLTLSLFGAGLTGVAAMRRRKKVLA
jgi:hypothetical protein